MYHRQERKFFLLIEVCSTNSCYSWLYMLVVAMDANFRLKSRLRGTVNKEPALGLGLAYFVNNGPYSEFLKDYVDQDEVWLAWQA
jgi:hypothetical protein